MALLPIQMCGVEPGQCIFEVPSDPLIVLPVTGSLLTWGEIYVKGISFSRPLHKSLEARRQWSRPPRVPPAL